jgi:hypothetical protein
MNINILTPDSTKPNLAAMKISAWHKAQGDNVELNFPLMNADFTYASVLYKKTIDPHADLIGGPKYPESKLDQEIEEMKPDYTIYPKMDYSLGYTYMACPRTCEFCVVPKQNNSEKHHSIFDFHDNKFTKIALMNNNTLADPYWRETFQEILDAKLTVKDIGGYDARLITDESAWYMSKIKWDGLIHLAWDFPDHKKEVLAGIKRLLRHGIKNIMVYVLIGETTHKENIYRVLRLKSMNIDPFIMPLNKDDPYQKRFARWVNFKAIFKTVPWSEYT